MSGIKVRAVTLKHLKITDDHSFAVQISMDSLMWFTLNTYKTEGEAIGQAKGLEAWLEQSKTFSSDTILWQSQR